MGAEIRKILNGIGLYVLFFTLGDIFMLRGGPGPLSWLLILAGAAGAAWHFYRNWPRLGRKRPGERV
jgi:hypothetical protein